MVGGYIPIFNWNLREWVVYTGTQNCVSRVAETQTTPVKCGDYLASTSKGTFNQSQQSIYDDMSYTNYL